MGDSKRATVYLDPHIHKALKIKAAESDQTISELVNKAVSLSLAEDAVDLEALKDRKKHSERSFSSFVRELRKDGLI
jgi:hypothetical protein